MDKRGGLSIRRDGRDDAGPVRPDDLSHPVEATVHLEYTHSRLLSGRMLGSGKTRELRSNRGRGPLGLQVRRASVVQSWSTAWARKASSYARRADRQGHWSSPRLPERLCPFAYLPVGPDRCRLSFTRISRDQTACRAAMREGTRFPAPASLGIPLAPLTPRWGFTRSSRTATLWLDPAGVRHRRVLWHPSGVSSVPGFLRPMRMAHHRIVKELARHHASLVAKELVITPVFIAVPQITHAFGCDGLLAGGAR